MTETQSQAPPVASLRVVSGLRETVIPTKGQRSGLCRGPRGKWLKSFFFNHHVPIITDIRKNLNWPIKPMNLRVLFSVGSWGCYFFLVILKTNIK